MNERDNIRIERIKGELDFIEKTLIGVTQEEFLSNKLLQHAISMSLITIGESAKHLSDDFKEKYPQIEWLQIIAVRNIAAHGYWQLDMRQIWKAMEEDIPILKEFFGEF